MRLYGLLERLTKIKLFNTKEVSIEPATQSGATDKVVSIPNLGTNPTQEMVLDLQQQTLTNKTLTSPIVGGTAQAPGAGNVNLASAANSLLITGQSGSTATISTASLSGAKTFTLPDNSGNIVTTGDTGSITSTMIANGTIVNEDVSSTAAIAGTKVSPDFGSQNVTTTGSVTGASIIVSGNTLGTGVGNSLNIGDANDEIAVPGNLTVSGNFTVNGTTTTVSTTNLLVEDKLVTLNDGGLAASGGGTGIEVEEDNVVTGYAKVTSDRNGWELKAPNSANVVTIPNSVAAGDVVLTAGTQSIAGLKTFSDNVTLSSTGSLKLPVGTDVQRPTGVQGMVRYNSDQNSFEGYDGTTWSGLGGGGTTDRITQANSFNVGDVVYLNGSTYTAAIATAANTAEVAGVVSKIVTAGTVFEITLVGEVSGLVAANFDEAALPAVGEVVFLSPTNPGKLTITEPSVVGQVSVPVGIVASSIAGPAVTLYVQPKRGVVVGGANLRTQIGLSNNATTTIQNAGSYDAGELAGWVYIDATTDSRFYVQAQFAKNAAGTDYNLAYQTTGDTPPAGFSVSMTSAGLIQITLPNLAGFVAGGSYVNFALNAPAVGTSLPLQVNSSNITWQSDQTFRNRIINGDMRIDQRAAGVSQAITLTSIQYLSVDRFLTFQVGAGSTGTIGQVAVTDLPGFSWAQRYTVTSTTDPTAVTVGQRIEGFNIKDLENQLVTISFYIKASRSVNTAVQLLRIGTTRSYVKNIAVTTSWVRQTITLTLESILNNANGNAMELLFRHRPDSSVLTSTEGSWVDADKQGITGTTYDFGNTQNDWIEITGVQLEAGPTATPFERRPYSVELGMCQRYATVYGGDGALEGIGYGFANSTTFAEIPIYLPVKMRIVPSASIVGNWQLSDGVTGTAAISITELSGQKSSSIYQIRFNVTSGLTQYRPYRVEAANSSASRIILNAEL